MKLGETMPIKQIDPHQLLKKYVEKEQINPLARRKAETQEQWAKRMRDSTSAEKKEEENEDIRSALLELNTLKQGTKGEEDIHEPPNKLVKDTRGRKTTFSDDDNKHT